LIPYGYERGKKMKSIIKWNDYKCNNCGDKYQGVYAYVHKIMGIVCVDCLNIEINDSKWA